MPSKADVTASPRCPGAGARQEKWKKNPNPRRPGVVRGPGATLALPACSLLPAPGWPPRSVCLHNAWKIKCWLHGMSGPPTVPAAGLGPSGALCLSAHVLLHHLCQDGHRLGKVLVRHGQRRHQPHHIALAGRDDEEAAVPGRIHQLTRGLARRVGGWWRQGGCMPAQARRASNGDKDCRPAPCQGAPGTVAARALAAPRCMGPPGHPRPKPPPTNQPGQTARRQ